jgi:Mn2+/Fe2+ NRAMP family transporter
MRAETASQAIKNATGAVAAMLVGAFALVFVLLATLAVTLAGVVIAAGALLARLAPTRRRAGGPVLLEGRRTPDGWVVEAAPPPA